MMQEPDLGAQQLTQLISGGMFDVLAEIEIPFEDGKKRVQIPIVGYVLVEEVDGVLAYICTLKNYGNTALPLDCPFLLRRKQQRSGDRELSNA